MFETEVADSASLWSQIEQGLACAATAHYADAATHLLRARPHIPLAQARIGALIDEFIDSHQRFWQAQQALNEASHRLVATQAQQQACLIALEQIVAQGGPARPCPPTSVEPAPAHRPAPPTQPGLAITCFGRFGVRSGGQALALCPNRNGQLILRYLVAQPRHRATLDALMDLLWPDDAPEVARHKLHVAASALRNSLRQGMGPQAGELLLCQNGVYQLNPAIPLQIDAEAFEAAYLAGQAAASAASIGFYEAACQLYVGPFLAEDQYADWPLLRREQLARMFLAMCEALAEHSLAAGRYDEAAAWALKSLHENRCDEAAHRLVMRAHAAAGRRAEALRQYQRCVQFLAGELGVPPMPETAALAEAIRQK